MPQLKTKLLLSPVRLVSWRCCLCRWEHKGREKLEINAHELVCHVGGIFFEILIDKGVMQLFGYGLPNRLLSNVPKYSTKSVLLCFQLFKPQNKNYFTVSKTLLSKSKTSVQICPTLNALGTQLCSECVRASD